MSINCSLYCLNNNPEESLNIAREIIKSGQIEVHGEEGNWLAFRYQLDKATLIVDRMNKEKSDVGYLELIDNTQSFVSSIDAKNLRMQSELINHIKNTVQILAFELDIEGVTFDEISEEILFSIAAKANAVIFTGNEFLNVKGGLVLDVEGTSEEAII
jgi:hypothetical protein